jgi:EF hand
MIAEGDVDDDGKISFDEFVTVMRSPSAAEKYRGFPILKAAFCFIDKSGNGEWKLTIIWSYSMNLCSYVAYVASSLNSSCSMSFSMQRVFRFPSLGRA